jgi:transposase-like protein
MASIRRAFTDEFKAESVRLVTVEGHPARQVARDLGIHESLLRRWQRKLEARQARAAGVKPSIALEHVAELEAKIAEMRAMSDTLQELADACHGDHRPDCPILRDLERSDARTAYGHRHAPSEKQAV